MYKSKKAYMYGTGRRKSSVARVHLFPGGTGAITINGRDIDDYFGLETLKLIVRQPLVTTGTVGKVDIEATVSGGGVTGQAGAVRHGIARALLEVDENYRAVLKAAGFLTPRSENEGTQEVRPQAARRAPSSQEIKNMRDGRGLRRNAVF
jgi:small subunit ribosomal protein S9